MVKEVADRAVFDDVCRVIGRAAVMVKQSGQVVNGSTIKMMLENHATQSNDDYMKSIYTVAQCVMA
ncbi:DUF2767 domain-containing protein [Dryocola clanedunensis]|uniref:DUF2767 domain-containing protein n=1 Tax=Cedecea sulfonylureivorans TaxID=3051154 RepID=UPI0019275CD2|nr:DUF2767 domain-containing protein [Cedecea sulfonylureivorans]